MLTIVCVVGIDSIEMPTIILENNYFEFDGDICWQKQGTAFGINFALAYANIFIYGLETRMLKKCEFKPWVASSAGTSAEEGEEKIEEMPAKT